MAPFTTSQVVLRTAGMVGSSGTAAAQSAAGMYREVYAVNRQRGMPEEQARRTALKPALIAGVITAALSYRGGANGAEASFREEGREVLKRTLWEHAKAMGRDITEEMLEEGADTFLQELTKMVHLYPDRSMRDILSVTLDGALTGGGVAGMMVGGRRVFGGGHSHGGPEGQPDGDGVPPYLSPEGGPVHGMARGQDLQLPNVRGQDGMARAGEANPLDAGAMHNTLNNGGVDNGGSKPGEASVPGREPLVPEMAGGPKVDEESGHAVPPGGGVDTGMSGGPEEITPDGGVAPSAQSSRETPGTDGETEGKTKEDTSQASGSAWRVRDRNGVTLEIPETDAASYREALNYSSNVSPKAPLNFGRLHHRRLPRSQMQLLLKSRNLCKLKSMARCPLRSDFLKWETWFARTTRTGA